MTYPLFVYGTLAPNRPNHHIMTPIVDGVWQVAHIYGDLLPNGWGASLGYPAVIPNDDGQRVDGFLFSSPDLNNHWQRLDEFEGDGYGRKLVTVHLPDGKQTMAYVYALAECECADWVANINSANAVQD